MRINLFLKNKKNNLIKMGETPYIQIYSPHILNKRVKRDTRNEVTYK
jgi:hypothetical protein